MVIQEYPKEFLEREKLYEPYLSAGTLNEAPEEIKKAYELNKEWLWKISH